jgi:hypothetical protein
VTETASLEGDSRFEAALEECCRRVREGQPLERCLADYPAEYGLELARLVPLALRVPVLRRDPSAAFVARLEERLASEAADRVGRRPAGGRQEGRGWLERLQLPLSLGRASVALVLGVLVLVGGGVGAVQASDEAMPESPLYRVKEAREWAELALARTPEAEVGVHVKQIAERGREMDRAARAGLPKRVLDVLAIRLGVSIDRAVDRALELRARGQRQPAERALGAVRGMRERVERLLPRAAADNRPTLARLATFLAEQERRLVASGQ